MSGAPRTVLACDTSTRTASIALVRDGVLLGEWTTLAPTPRSALLLADVSALLARHGLSPPDVDLFVTSVGPGSFTGVRTAMATLKGLAYATGRPLAAVGSLEALAHPAIAHPAIAHPAIAHPAIARDAPGAVLVALDARRGEVYGALARRSDGAWLIEPAVIGAADLAARAAAIVPEGEVQALGEGVLAYPDAFAAGLGGRLRVGEPGEHGVRASVLAFLGAARPPAPIADVEPAYLRRPEAEVNLMKARASQG
ncbi:MAG: tRNA (adenosine(37)-N6)-threonylcarbamoyltransferase complex dimerization subunit type 1 TsaB [Deltaproteobacteria bacterium]|nr:tRNA (adenosine(37)-N6)-threonylcarbamoyltransferase complex dimerization subunit type 1 TsaB [Deltaproteobacteria bacterium]